MPLPSALASRLARRGLITKNASAEDKTKNADSLRNQNNSEIEEEVIAESYDDQENQGNSLNRINNSIVISNESDGELDDIDLRTRKFRGHPGCPNKYNVFHECTLFCKEHWKEGRKEPDPKYLKRKAAMLSKHPLPSHWKEIYDPGTGRHYYWEADSDSVSWLPPSHPKAVISESAAFLREEQAEGVLTKNDKDIEEDEREDEKSDYSSEDESDEELKRREEKRRRIENEEKRRARGRIKTRENDLDPMDPASYSDIPRGGWSDGLSKGNEAKTGADVTAAGPLYQMRPYPNPGAVLRANARNSQKPDHDKDDENS